jgi:glycosyltransferase involved in cell wall biosynthesis
MEYSIVIITKNEANNLAFILPTLKQLSNNIVVVDSNSTDETRNIAASFGAEVHVSDWQGYGATKNMGNSLAKHDWILSLDADELPDANMIAFINNWQPTAINEVLALSRYMVWNKKLLKFGASKEQKIRLFNRLNAQWDTQLVHEGLIFQNSPKIIKANGKLLHYSYKNQHDARLRNKKYALLSAQEKHKNHKSTYPWVPYVQWVLKFSTNYFIKFGFLDGIAGLQYANETAVYSFNKYRNLYSLQQA